MTLVEMCEKAKSILKKDGLHGIYRIVDVGDMLVFYGGNPNEVYYGVRTVSVHKETGEVDWYMAQHNRDVLKNAKTIDIPNEYIYKAS